MKKTLLILFVFIFNSISFAQKTDNNKFPENLCIPLKVVDQKEPKGYPTQSTKAKLEDIKYLDFYSEPFEVVEKGNDITINNKKDNWYKINLNDMSDETHYAWFLSSDIGFLKPNIVKNISEYSGYYKNDPRYVCSYYYYIKVNIADSSLIMTEFCALKNEKGNLINESDSIVDPLKQKKLLNPQINGCVLTSQDSIPIKAWFAISESKTNKKAIKGLLFRNENGTFTFYRKE
jgi:hypothetical protein